MKRILAIVVLLLFTVTLAEANSGCIFSTRGRAHHGRHYRGKKRKKRRSCRRNERWDGRRCRHKGRGHGARKHDR